MNESCDHGPGRGRGKICLGRGREIVGVRRNPGRRTQVLPCAPFSDPILRRSAAPPGEGPPAACEDLPAAALGFRFHIPVEQRKNGPLSSSCRTTGCKLAHRQTRHIPVSLIHSFSWNSAVSSAYRAGLSSMVTWEALMPFLSQRPSPFVGKRPRRQKRAGGGGAIAKEGWALQTSETSSFASSQFYSRPRPFAFLSFVRVRKRSPFVFVSSSVLRGSFSRRFARVAPT